MPDGLVAPSRTHWYLYCQLDGGMNQGRTALFATTDRGTNWTLIAEGSPEGPNRGTSGAEMVLDLTISGNGRVLWLLGAVDGVASSTDGGRSWTTVAVSRPAATAASLQPPDRPVPGYPSLATACTAPPMGQPGPKTHRTDARRGRHRRHSARGLATETLMRRDTSDSSAQCNHPTL